LVGNAADRAASNVKEKDNDTDDPHHFDCDGGAQDDVVSGFGGKRGRVDGKHAAYEGTISDEVRKNVEERGQNYDRLCVD
jgi:hypothetical protein